MIVRALLIILIIFIILAVIVPLLLNALGVPIFSSGGDGSGRAASTPTSSEKTGILFRSPDRGREWDSAEFIRGRGVRAPSGVLDIAFDPTDAKVVLVGTKGAGLWKSMDGGITYKQVRDTNGALDAQSDIYAVAISQTRPETIYLAAFQARRGRVFRSEDRGATFGEIYSATQDRFGVFDVYTPPGSPDTAMIATGEGRILETRDGGVRWRIVRSIGEPIRLLAANPAFSGERYAITERGYLSKTFDSGLNWADLGDPILSPGSGAGIIENPYANWSIGFGLRAAPFSFAVNPANPPNLYFIKATDLLESADGGFSWQKITSLTAGEGTVLGGVGVSRGDLFVSAGADLYKSGDRARSWEMIPIAEKGTLRNIFIHPHNQDIIFITAEP